MFNPEGSLALGSHCIFSIESDSQIKPHYVLKSPKSLPAEAFPGGFVKVPEVYAYSRKSKLFCSLLCVVDERPAVSLITMTFLDHQIMDIENRVCIPIDCLWSHPFVK